MTPSQDFVPEWAKRAVWYQIFPDRFRNGDPANDPTLESAMFSYPHDYSLPWRVHPWTSDWYELQPYERAAGLDLWKSLQRRRYGGDLQGVLDKLDYLQDLGVNALYLNPVFDAASLHKYDGNTYHHVDVHFGPDPLGDRRLIASETPDDPATWAWTAADTMMLQVIAEVHRRGMRLIFDGVFNHMGLNSWPFRDVVGKGRASRFRDWFKITDWETPGRFAPFTYTGWTGVPELPELNQDADGLTAGPREYIFACTRRWMTPAAMPGGLPAGVPEDGGGVDGWRLDVAFCIRHGFWKAWRRHVKALNPEAYLVAEIVLEDEDEPYLQGDEFDAVMHYRWAFACAEFFAETRSRITASEFDRQLSGLRAAHPAGVAHGLHNLLDSHDTARLASLIVNRRQSRYRDWKEHHPRSQVQNNPAYETRPPTAEERALQRLMVLFQMTYVGAPVVYYGDEAGMWGANDPCCRKPMVWPELAYAPEVMQPAGTPGVPAPVAFDHDLHAMYKRLIALRHRLPALSVGDYRTLLADDAAGVFAFLRTHAGERAAVVINNQPAAQSVTLDLEGRWADALDGGRVYAGAGGRLIVDAPALWGCVLTPA